MYLYIYVYVRVYRHDHHVSLAWISLTLPRHSSLLSNAFAGPSDAMCVNRSAVEKLCVKGSTGKCRCWVRPYFSSSIPHVWFIWFEWLYGCCFVECCFQDLFSIARSILVQFLSSFFFQSKSTMPFPQTIYKQ